ncbi:unnamed protein product [Miscanthus lutarioriparius]|uniref:Pectate lyase N-terminal domain-containing protein n=1 Tax=Miscanthus lutarioriparius TaxID=422564 RepID=A0A811Q5V3_9POAL|nr:unnamed protein product [Miscanthus lutarioriparius]
METKLRWSRPGSLLVAAAFLASAAVSSANIGDFDEHWQKRKELAEASVRETYRSDPYNVTNSFNVAVHRHACTPAFILS